MSEPVEVIYVLGSGHSGSTLLDLLLGSHSLIEGVGEVKQFYDYIRSEHALCSCGALFSECPYWKEVRTAITRQFGTDQVNLRDSDRENFKKANYTVFRAVLAITHKKYICDSSKSWSRLEGLLHSKLFDVHVIHLVRDGRAVAFSNKRKGRSVYKHALRWQNSNLRTMWRLRHHAASHQLVKYEELCQAPLPTLEKLLSPLGIRAEESQLHFSERTCHNVGGNRMRRNKNQGISLDTEYISHMSSTEWLLSTMLCFPMLICFGYPMMRGASGAEPEAPQGGRPESSWENWYVK